MQGKNWSAKITKTSFALDLEEGVFTWNDPKIIAKSLTKSAEVSTRRKTTLLCRQCPCLIFTSTVQEKT